MKLTPHSTARCRARSESSSLTSPQAPPIAQAPKLISETFQPVRPSGLYLISAGDDNVASIRLGRHVPNVSHTTPLLSHEPIAGDYPGDPAIVVGLPRSGSTFLTHVL